MSDPQVTYRPATEGDVREAFALFRRSLFHYLGQTGAVSADAAANPPIEADWKREASFVLHLARNATEHWVAESSDGRTVGWALSIEREGGFELVFFFVDPAEQAKGIGRALLERAFPLGRGRQRIVLATGHERALGLYLRFGVHGIGSSLSLFGTPRPVEISTDLRFERAASRPTTIAAIAAIERELLGHARVPEIEFFLGERPAWLAWRGDRVVGFAIGSTGEDAGPIGALEPGDIPALLGLVEHEAHAQGHADVWFSAPMANWQAVDHLLGRGFRIFPFTAYELASEPIAKLDRWIHTSPDFIL